MTIIRKFSTLYYIRRFIDQARELPPDDGKDILLKNSNKTEIFRFFEAVEANLNNKRFEELVSRCNLDVGCRQAWETMSTADHPVRKAMIAIAARSEF